MNPLTNLRRLGPSTGLLRSLLIYYGRPDRDRRLARFYANFIRPGDLCFDIGAHVGARTRLWTQLGARVVAVEPQPLFAQWLRRSLGDSTQVSLVEAAVAAHPGDVALHISRRTPTVSTASPAWIEQVQQSESFSRVRWDTTISVPSVTLDQLIAIYGPPAFCKIDVEGYESEALQGLSTPLRALSVEYVPAAKDVAIACIERLADLADYRFNWSVSEQHIYETETWLDADDMRSVLAAMPIHAPSGDIFARTGNAGPAVSLDAADAPDIA